MSTPPLVPSEVDLRDFAFMPLDVVRLRDSDLVAVATEGEFMAAVMLWCASWHQRPAASLPDDDAILAKLAGLGRDLTTWRARRDGALRGWVRCDDGRLYHPVIAEKAIEAWKAKQAQRAKTEAARKAKAERGQPPKAAEPPAPAPDTPAAAGPAAPDNPSVTETVTETVTTPSTASKGQGQGQGQGQGKEEDLPFAARRRVSLADSFEGRCRIAVGEEPVVTDVATFHEIAALVELGDVTEADVMAGIAAAMATPGFRIKFWRQLVGWARGAAKDRLLAAAKPEARAGPAPPRTNGSKWRDAIMGSRNEHEPDDPDLLDLTANPVGETGARRAGVV